MKIESKSYLLAVYKKKSKKVTLNAVSANLNNKAHEIA